jgi:N-glycosylase/DNA lyase
MIARGGHPQPEVSAPDIARVKEVVDKYISDPWVRDRHSRNLAESKPKVSKETFWQVMVSMRLTTLQESGPLSQVAEFNQTRPFPLRYELVAAKDDAKRFIGDVLRETGLLRFSNKISDELSANFYKLEGGEWSRALEECNRLTVLVTGEIEREVADYVDQQYKGFGPKQARNVLQELGLTRYEIPIDSRVTRWLNGFGFPIRLNASALGDRDFYVFVLDGIQTLCERAGVFPCILDMAVFVSQERRNASP